MPSDPTITKIVEFGLDSIPHTRKIEVSLRDLMFVFQTLGEFNRFSHQPMHYPDLKAVEAFLGSRGDGGAYDILSKAYYDKCRDMIPADIVDALGEGAFDHPQPPFYYKGLQGVPEQDF